MVQEHDIWYVALSLNSLCRHFLTTCLSSVQILDTIMSDAQRQGRLSFYMVHDSTLQYFQDTR